MPTPPTRWPAPPSWAHGGVRLRPLTRSLLDADLAAYRASPQAIFAHSAGRWPGHLDRTEDEELVALHEREHCEGTAFAYALLEPDRDAGLGCAYLRPLAGYVERTGCAVDGAPAGAAILTFWVLDDEAARPPVSTVLDLLGAWVRAWDAAPVLLRCLPEEAGHVAAATGAGLAGLTASGQELPYRWFRIS